MYFRYHAMYFRQLLSVMHFARSAHAVTTSQLFLPSRKMMKFAALGCFLAALYKLEEAMGTEKWYFS